MLFISPVANIPFHDALFLYLLMVMNGFLPIFLITILVMIFLIIVAIIRSTMLMAAATPLPITRIMVMHGHVLNRLLVIGTGERYSGLGVFVYALVQFQFALYVFTAIKKSPVKMKAALKKELRRHGETPRVRMDLRSGRRPRLMFTPSCICSPLISLALDVQPWIGMTASSFKRRLDGRRRVGTSWTITGGQ